jgi:CheY-like chemotaxis protein
MKKILIVDDSSDVHDLIEIILQEECDVSFLDNFDMDFSQYEDDDEDEDDSDEKFKVEHAFQGEEAIEKVKQAESSGKPFELTFMDVRMPPGINGIETIGKISQEFPNKNFIVCSGYMEYSKEELTKQLGEKANILFLRKPFTSDKLKSLVEEFLKISA